MSDTPLYTLREIARHLDLPESTVRYYRDAFAAFIPTVGTGRRRRYPPEGVAILRSIAHGFAHGKTRELISTELSAGPEITVDPQPVTPVATEPAGFAMVAEQELLSAFLDGERERRDAMWQMAREIARLGEAVERQHVLLGELANLLANRAHRTLGPGTTVPSTAESPATTELSGELKEELEALREQLSRERELVERLRKSKLEIERRAAEAEANLERQGPQSLRRSVLSRLISRSPPEESE